MLINNPEALKGWLIIVLEPLCDADSSALARYVLALLKKDKTELELKRVMIEQLEVFLAEETTPFVDRLFQVINSEEYLPSTSTNATTTIAPTTIPTPAPITAPTIASPSLKKTVENLTPVSSLLAMKSPSSVKPQPDSKLNLSTLEILAACAPTSLGAAVSAHLPQLNELKTKEVPSFHKAHEYQSIQPANTATTIQHGRSASPAVTKGSAASAAVAPTTTLATGSLADKENLPRESRRRRASLRSRSRSRSRSNERSRRSRSRDRRPNNNVAERDSFHRFFRNKSPPQSAHMRHVGSHDRRRGGAQPVDRRNRLGGGGGGSGLPDERSPRNSNAAIESARNKGPSGGRSNRSHSRSHSPSPERGGSSNKVNKTSPSGAQRSGGSPDRHHHPQAPLSDAVGSKRQRCRDFDEKGYCVRGETCPWDHGVNPVVFEDINNSALISISMREYNPDAPDLWSRTAATGPLVQSSAAGLAAAGLGASGINPFSGSARPAGVMMGVGVPAPVGFPPMPNVGVVDKVPNGANLLTADYVRNAAAGGGFRAAAPMMPFPFNPVATPLQRELIPIPVVDATSNIGGDIGAMQQTKRRYELEDSVAIAEGPTKRKLPINSRLGSRMSNIQTNCSLELRKVPRGLNTIAHLNNHFAKFGKIVNIQISYDGDPEAAIITFSAHAEANVAYRSTEAVLNNRFIKVFWHNQDSNNTALNMDNAMMSTGPGGGGRKNSQYHLTNVPAVPTPTADSAKTINSHAATSQAAAGGADNNGNAGGGNNQIGSTDLTNANAGGVTAATHVPAPSLRLKNNVTRNGPPTAVIRKKQEEQAKAVVQLANGLRKRKQELLQSYVKQVKSALELVERCEPNDPQRAMTLTTIKGLQDNIDKLRKEIATEQELMQAKIQQNNQQPPFKKTKEQQKKELLDIELELFAQQQEGNDTTAIQKRFEDLQRSLCIVPGSLGAAGGAIGGGPNHGNTIVGPGGVGAIGNKPAHFAANRANTRRPAFTEGSTRVDRRPKAIVVTGFASEEADSILGHFKHFGEITKHDVDKDIPQLILSYATRLNAEQAVLRGKFYKDTRLQISWAPVIVPKPTALTVGTDLIKTDVDIAKLSTSIPLSINAKAISELDLVGDIIPELRLEDEEEDEESEDRSWRR